MKIAVIGAKGLPARQGGIEHYCAELYPRIVAQGHAVDLYARSSYTDATWLETHDFQGVRVVSLPCLKVRGLDAFVSSALGAIAASGDRYDVIHFHALGPALFSWLPRLATTANVVLTCQGLDWQRAKWGALPRFLIQLGEKSSVRYAHEIIVVSEALRAYFLQTYGRHTVYIPNGPASYTDSDPTFTYGRSLGLEPGQYVVFLGRLVPEKCPDLLIQAFQTLQPANWKLVVAGGTSDTSAYLSHLTDLGAGNPNIIFTGELRGKRLAEIVRSAGLFALPSNLEGLPLAMLEAMQEGVPVLASNIPPHRQLLERDRGVLFAVDDLDACIQSLAWAIHHPQDIRRMADRAREYVRLNYTWDKITADTLGVYERLCAPPAAASEAAFDFSKSLKSSK